MIMKIIGQVQVSPTAKGIEPGGRFRSITALSPHAIFSGVSYAKRVRRGVESRVSYVDFHVKGGFATISKA